MGSIGKILSERIIADFTSAYEEYIARVGVADIPVVRLGYWTAIARLFIDEPIPNEEAQEMLLVEVDKVLDESQKAVTDKVEVVFERVVKRRSLTH